MNKTSFYFLITFLCMAFIGCNGMAELFHGPKPETLTYTVTFNANGGSGTVPARTGIEGTGIILPDGTGLFKSGFAFDGWNINTSGTGVNYNAGSSYTITGDITLYARWIIGYTVTFDANGGSGNVPAMAAAGGTNITLPSGSGFSRSGYTFDGWNTNASGTGTDYDTGTLYTVNGNTTLYAKWETAGYDIGDIGPGGGKIFYFIGTGFSMSDNGERCYYLEAIEIGRYAWASSGYANTNIAGTSTTIGSGRRNTALILAADTNAPAAKACRDFPGGGKNDWFLPSQNEFNQLVDSSVFYWEMEAYRGGNGNFWSSSQASNTRAYAWLLQVVPHWTLSDHNSGKTLDNIVYAVRAF